MRANVCLAQGASNYKDGAWLLYVSFPQDYPQVAPEVRAGCPSNLPIPGLLWLTLRFIQIRFVTPIRHCNINVYGKIW